MKILGTTVPIITADMESAIARYSTLTREPLRYKFAVPDRGIVVAMVGSVAIIAGDAEGVALLKDTRATFNVDSLDEYEAHLRASGATILQSPSRTPAGRNMIARDVEGVVFEFVELHPHP